MIKRLLRLNAIVLFSFSSIYSLAYEKSISSHFIALNLEDEISIWDGNSWSNGIPTISTEVIIRGNLVITEDFAVKKLTLESTGSVHINSGVSLMIVNELINHATADKFIVEDGGNLIQQNDVNNVGSITVYKNSTAMVRNDMTFWSSPVEGQNVRQFSPETLYNRFWKYNESIDEFYQILNSETDPQTFDKGIGYSIRVRNTLLSGQTTMHHGKFVGNPFNGYINVPVQYTGNGYNLIGNPYASAIDIGKFFAANPQAKAIYIWTHQYPVDHADYANNYTIITRGGTLDPSLNQLNVGQGFIVKVDQDDVSPIVFTNDMRVINMTTKNRYWLDLSQSNEIKNQIMVGYVNNATNNFDVNMDQVILDTYNTAIYSLVDDENLVIDARALPFETADVVQLGFKTVESGEFTIRISGLEGLFEEGQTIFIQDSLNNTVHNLKEGEYNFTSVAGTFNDRFQLLYVEEELGMMHANLQEGVVLFKNNQHFTIKSEQTLIQSVEIYDVQGRLVRSYHDVNAKLQDIHTTSKGVNILKITLENGNTLTKKLIN